MAKGSSRFGKYKEGKVREALRNPINVLKSLSEKSQEKTYKYQRLYRNLYNPEFYLRCNNTPPEHRAVSVEEAIFSLQRQDYLVTPSAPG